MLGSSQGYSGGTPMAKRARMNDPYGSNVDLSIVKSSQSPPPIRSSMISGGHSGVAADFVGSAMPTRVLQVRGLLDGVVEADLVDALSHFGPVSYVSLASRGLALVEFEDVAAAERCISFYNVSGISVLGAPAQFSYANMAVIPRQGLESERPSNVLIMYVQNPKYPITTDVIYAICKTIARVNRIVINRQQNGISALVELADIDSARATKQRLNGCDIYSGCCTLKIEYAKLTRLNVVRNDNDQCDYVNGVGLSGAQSSSFNAAVKDRPALLTEPSPYSGNVDQRGYNGQISGSGGGGGGRSFGKAGYETDHRIGEGTIFQNLDGSYGDENPVGFDEYGRPIFEEPGLSRNVGLGLSMQNDGGTRLSGGYLGGSGGGSVRGLDDYHSAAQAQMAALNAAASGGGQSHNIQQQQQSQPAFVGAPQPAFGAVGSHANSSMLSGGGGNSYLGSYDQNSMMRQEESYHHHSSERLSGNAPDGCGVGQDNAVLMVYGLDTEHVNCDKLFNLLCLYGNVMRIKFLKSKNDTVMIQMGDTVAAQRAMEHLRNCVIFGKKMHMSLSRQPHLNEVREPLELPDKSTSYKDYSNSRLNRFLTPDIAGKNRINSPQKFLYFFNAPPNIGTERLTEVLEKHRCPRPVEIKLFPQRGSYTKNSAGLIEFEDEMQATEALMMCNHALMDADGSRYPFVLKLCFAGPANTAIGGEGGGSERSRGRDRESSRSDRYQDFGRRESRSSNYNGPGGPRSERDSYRERSGRDRDRDRDNGSRGERSSSSRHSTRGRGRGRGGGR